MKHQQEEKMIAQLSDYRDIQQWMTLAGDVCLIFPGLENGLENHKNTVLHFMERKEALCIKASGEFIGALLFSQEENMICFLAVSPTKRRKGAGALLVTEALKRLDRKRNITVTTFCEKDPQGAAARALYRKFDFIEADIIQEFESPCQRFILHALSSRT